MQNVATPLRYDIFCQDLTKQYLAIELMAWVETMAQAKTVVKLFNEIDKLVGEGKHTYLIVCRKLQGEN